MKSHFDNVSMQVSLLTTRTYSTSFSLGIHLLSPVIRNAIYSIYGFVRCADEIVDSFEGYDKKYLLEKYASDTFEALDQQISLNPILNAFQQTVHKYSIPVETIRDFLGSMSMDLDKKNYDRFHYENYIYGSAEVVGIMCLHVFCENNAELFFRLKPSAMMLGAAFQKVNFLRDMKEDLELRGRIYFPGVEWSKFDDVEKKKIETEIAADFREGLKGIRQLPASSRGGVYLEYVYYQSLFRKICRMPSHKIMSGRVRIHNGKKFTLMCNSMVQYKLNLI